MAGADGWLNELKNLAAAFKDDAEVSAALKPFYIWSMLASLGLMALLAWSPVGVWILTVSHSCTCLTAVVLCHGKRNVSSCRLEAAISCEMLSSCRLKSIHLV